MKKKSGIWRRLTAFALTAVMMVGILPAAAPEARAAEWMEPYLNQVVDWGVMRGDASGNLNPDAPITRAQFVTMVNRAFGYTEMGPNPFTDVSDNAWYANDIRIAYQAGYFTGTSPTTASPNALVTREQAAVLIGRNLRLPESNGVSTPFADDDQLGTWSRSLVKEAAELGIILGYEDGAFRPKVNVSRGQVACFLVRALGSLIHEPGEYDNMGVYGNLAINTPGVTLRNALITGNLYLTGGVGLGDLVLENVEVQGRIIIAGGGEAQGGESSIMLRNVTAGTVDVDSLANQFVTIRAEGLTSIGTANVRTQAYLEDVTENGLGFKQIRFEAEDGSRLDLAGNIKDFVNLTPNAAINLAQGVIQKVTMDEKAAGSTVNVDGTTSVGEFNLDVGTTITGTGDVAHMNVNAEGTTSSILPDTIVVRPGIISNIKGEQMDSNAAAESSEDPRILAGYPTVRNVASRSATAVFSTNKAGTLYWGISALTDGSLGEEELTTTSTTANPKVIRKGTVNVSAGKTEVTAAVSGLTVGGSYYVSALLQDNRGQRSAVKVTAFVTPDDTTPAFVNGYPEAILAENDEGEQIIQARVMANKNCQLYYALMPNNATAPTAADFKANSLSGNLGHGIVDLRKNVPWLIPQVNSTHLREETDYDLYLWLTDADGARSSAVRKLDVRTLDKTPPIITDIGTTDDPGPNSVPMQVTMNEPGTLYWAVVKEGAPFYKQDASETDPLPNTENAKMQIETGLGALRKGSVNVNQADTPINFTVAGLAPQTGYDLYFVAKDRAGNYCVFPSDNVKDDLVPPIQIRTQDGISPTVKQNFLPDGDTLTPHSDNSIELIFSERVQGIQVLNGRTVENNFLELYDQVVSASAVGKGEKEAKDALAAALAAHIRLYRVGSERELLVRTSANENDEGLDWIVDYRKARVEMDQSGTGEMIITLPYNENAVDSALNLGSGVTYYFTLTGIQDMTGNSMEGVRGITTLARFKTLSASVKVEVSGIINIAASETILDKDGVSIPHDDIEVDLSFTLEPDGTSAVPPEELWDLLLWTNKAIDFDLYSRTQNGSGSWGNWNLEGTVVGINPAGAQDGMPYVSLMNYTTLRNKALNFDSLNQLSNTMEFAVHINRINSSSDRDTWDETITMRATVLEGDRPGLRLTSPAAVSDKRDLDQGLAAGADLIGEPNHRDMIIPIRTRRAPKFDPLSYPQVEPGDVSATLRVMLDSDGTVYYVAVPVTAGKEGGGAGYDCALIPTIGTGTSAQTVPLRDIPEVNPELTEVGAYTGAPLYQSTHPAKEVDFPYVTQITAGIQGTPGVVSGSSLKDYPDQNGVVDGKVMKELQIEDLQADTTYILYIVTMGLSPVYSEKVMAFQFTTVEAMLPIITVNRNGNTSATINVNRTSDVSYILVPTNSLTASGSGSAFAEPFSGNNVNSQWDEVKSSYTSVKTILDAMLTPYSINQIDRGSVFDHFANPDIKSRYAGLIRQSEESGVLDIADSDLDKRVAATNGNLGELRLSPLRGMQNTDWYTLLVTGKTVNGSGYAFRASRSYYNTSQTLISVTNCDLTGSSDTVGSATPTCSGTLRLNFSEPLHYRYKDGTTGEEKRYPIDSCPQNDGKHTGNSDNISSGGYINIYSENIMQITPLGTGNITLSNAIRHDSQIAQLLTFNVDHVRAGSTIFFQMNLCGATHGVRENSTLTITIKYDPPAAGSSYNTDGRWYAEAVWSNP